EKAWRERQNAFRKGGSWMMSECVDRRMSECLVPWIILRLRMNRVIRGYMNLYGINQGTKERTNRKGSGRATPSLHPLQEEFQRKIREEGLEGDTFPPKPPFRSGAADMTLIAGTPT